MRRGNTARRAAWAACLAAITGAASVAAAQPAEPDAAGGTGAATELTPADATAELARLRGWMRAGTVPSKTEIETETETQTGAGAGAASGKVRFAAVTLRIGGRVIGRGESARMPGGALESDPVAEAARAALEAGRERVARAESGLLAETAWPRVEPDVRVTLELSGSAIPLDDRDQRLAGAARRAGLAGLVVRPGLEGVAARRGELIAWRGLSWLRERDQSPAAAMASLAGRLTGDPSMALDPLPDLVGRGFVFLRVPVLELAEVGPARTPVFLHRGGEMVPPGSVDSAALRDAGRALAGHLEARAWPGVEPLGLRGGYDARRARYQPAIASPLEQGLAVAALERWAGAANDDRAAALAERLRAELGRVHDDETAPWADAPSAAAAVLAGLEGPARRRCVDAVTAAFDGRAFDEAALPRGAGGLAAHALVRAAAAGEVDPETAAAAVRAVYRNTSPETLIGQMPFLAMASIELSRLRGEPIAARAALRDLREVVAEHRLGPGDVDRADRDLLGATVFTRGPALLPSWQSARSSALTAVMLGQPALTPVDDPGAVASLVVGHWRSVRFLVQLQALRRGIHAYPEPEVARGGVRAAAWSDAMPVLASALTLWTYAETLDALERVRPALEGAAAGAGDR